jgi:hypothetical protein
MRKIWSRFVFGVASLALGLISVPANATFPCDFLTGGGWIVPFGAKANFGVGGGCKHGSPTWGHLQYIDRGATPPPTITPLNVHWLTITAYRPLGPSGDAKDPKRTGTRDICGTARTNQLYGDVYFVVRTRDAGEPGVNDTFDIRLRDRGPNGEVGAIVYSTEFEGFPHKLGNGGPGGGNIQLHKPNPSTSGEFGGSCPALDGPTALVPLPL